MPRNSRRHHAVLTAPDLPAPSTLEPTHELQLVDSRAYAQLLVTNADLANQSARDILLEQSVYRGVDFSETRLASSQCLDLRFERCTALHAQWEKLHMQRVEWLDSQLVGLQLIEAWLEDARFARCRADYALFSSARFRSVRFEQCRLQDAAFDGADLTGVIFHECDLSGADFRGAILSDTDIRSSTIAGLQVGIKELRGLIIAPEQAIELATLLGVVVKPYQRDGDAGDGHE